MEAYFQELRLSRAFSIEFEKFWQENPTLIPADLLKAYMLLKQQYELEINGNIS
jgi:hypothetical protein